MCDCESVCACVHVCVVTCVSVYVGAGVRPGVRVCVIYVYHTVVCSTRSQLFKVAARTRSAYGAASLVHHWTSVKMPSIPLKPRLLHSTATTATLVLMPNNAYGGPINRYLLIIT